MQEVGHMSWNIYMCLLVGARWIEELGVYLSLCDFVGGTMNANIWVSHDVKM